MVRDRSLDSGYKVIDGFLTEEELLELSKDIEQLTLSPGSGGIRNLEKKSKAVRSYIQSAQLMKEAGKYLIGHIKFVRAILFDKTVSNNWLVPWHQDKTVSVSKRFDLEGWGPWSVKDGVIHVQPPLDVLNQMVTFRIYLADSGLDNGCLKLISHSHLSGVLTQQSIQEIVCSSDVISCVAKRGAAIIMHPHVLHSSAKAVKPFRRPVLHLEFSSYELPEGVFWSSG